MKRLVFVCFSSLHTDIRGSLYDSAREKLLMNYIHAAHRHHLSKWCNSLCKYLHSRHQLLIYIEEKKKKTRKKGTR